MTLTSTTANLNGIRAAKRKGVSKWLARNTPDIWCMQETRAPQEILDEMFQDFGATYVEPGRIAKSLSFKLDERTILVVAAGDVKVDNGKYKAAFGGKAKMLTPDEAVERIGHAVGGVCPFAVKPGTEVYLDESLRRFDTVLPAAGSSNSCIELTLQELETYAETTRWVDVCKPREG